MPCAGSLAQLESRCRDAARIGTPVETFIDNLTTRRRAGQHHTTVPTDQINWFSRRLPHTLPPPLLAHLIERQARRAHRDLPPSNTWSCNDGVRVICVSYLEPGSPKNARYLARRLRKRMPGLPLIAGFWSVIEDDTHYLDSFEATECDFLANNLRQAVDQIIALMKKPASEGRFVSKVVQPEEETVTD